MNESRPVALDTTQIIDLLPHSHPFLILDLVDELIPGDSAIGTKNITISDPVFSGHFPGQPIYPGVLMIEMAAQLCGIILGLQSQVPIIGYLASIKRFKFSELVRPGDQLKIHVAKRVSIGPLTEFTVDIRKANSSAASGALAIAISDRQQS